ncbi:MAG TPA: YceI family protein [bacterium]|nr:YceI family protein [bacterium]
MKRILPFLSFLALTATPALAGASSWDLDSAHTVSGFQATHMMFNTVRGEFGKTTGTVTLDDADLTKSAVDVTIDASTIDTRVPDRDTHLKSKDFFWVEKYPSVTFKSTKIEKVAENKYKVTGDLTMRGVTRPVVLDVDGPSKELKNPWGQPVRAVHATGTLKRSEWGLTWNKALEAGGVLVSDDIGLDINAELNPHVAAKSADLKADKPAAEKSAKK